jgi:hypothetical protein
VKSFITSMLCLGLLLSFTAHAQLVKGFGVKIGVTAANQSWDYTVGGHDPSTQNRWGITGSAFVELLNMPYLSLIVEGQYTQKGMSMRVAANTVSNPDGTGEFVTLRPSADYFSVPLLVKIRFQTAFLSPYLIAGPRYDFVLARHGDGFDPVFNELTSSEPGATVGVGVELHAVFPIDALLELRYNASLKDAFGSSYLKVRNHTVDILLGVRL